MSSIQITPRLADEDIPEFQPDLMVKLLATIDENQHPNLVLIISLEAKDNATIMFGEFIKGKSKKNLDRNPKCGVAFMTLANDYWAIQGDFTHWEYEGPDYEYYNNKSLFRNNAYTGIARVGYIDIKKVINKRKIKLERSVLRQLKKYNKSLKSETPTFLPSFVEKIFRAPSNLKYIAYIDEAGYPLIVPTMHLIPTSSNQLVFTPGGFGEDLTGLKEGKFITVFAMNIEELIMYQIKGTYKGTKTYENDTLGVIAIEEVYCCMPPKGGDRIV